ncbi:MAG: response regulator transcription factor [Bacteroidetes bacterium]|nr:response regulator transcription factor [Bacteroidota bacterium]
MSAITSIIIADSSPLFRFGLKTVLERDERYVVLGEAESEAELLQMLTLEKPDLLVLDCLASGFSIDTVLQCARANRKTRMIAITASQNGLTIVNALRAGITSYIKKDCSMSEVLEAIEVTGQGGTFFCGQILDAIRRESIDVSDLDLVDLTCDPVVLTQREIQVLILISEGMTNVQIADKFFLSNHTVNTHRKNIMQKLGVNNTASMVMYAVKSGFVSPNKFLFQQSN